MWLIAHYSLIVISVLSFFSPAVSNIPRPYCLYKCEKVTESHVNGCQEISEGVMCWCVSRDYCNQVPCSAEGPGLIDSSFTIGEDTTKPTKEKSDETTIYGGQRSQYSSIQALLCFDAVVLTSLIMFL